MTDRAPGVLLSAVLACVLATVAALAVYGTWGALDRPGLYHDEKAYLLQARIYAGLNWTEPTPPVAQLWEQVHVFVEPRYASKYPPGFPAVLAVGAAVGRPGVVPVALAAATAAVVFLFGQRFVGHWAAFVATALWIAAPANTAWRAAYFSESLTGLLWIGWSWFAWRYRERGRRRDLVLTSLLVAFAGITRPVTAIALAVPTVTVLWRRLRATAGRRDALAAVAAGLIICAVVPVWNRAVLGSWTRVPYAAYSAHTFPFDLPGFSLRDVPPPRVLPPDFEVLAAEQRRSYEARAVADLPLEFVRRLDRLAADALPGPLSVLRYLAPLGLLALGGAGLVALGSLLLLVVAHLTMPHAPNWSIYYLEVFPVVAFGVVAAFLFAWRSTVVRAPVLVRVARAGVVAGPLVGAGLLVAGLTVWSPPQVESHGWMRREAALRSGICQLPPGPKIVFVAARPNASPHHSLVDNDPHWARSAVWVVRAWDTARHRALMAAAPERTAYYYDERTGWFLSMHADGIPEAPPGVLHVLQVDLRRGRGLACR